MRSVPNFRQPEFRERVTQAIFGLLAQMPEPERNIFLWTHYRGYSPKQIAELARCSISEVEAALHKLNSTLCRRTRSLIDQDPQFITQPFAIHRQNAEAKSTDDTHDSFSRPDGNSALTVSGWIGALPVSHVVTE